MHSALTTIFKMVSATGPNEQTPELDDLLANAATLQLNQSEVDQLKTIKRIYTMLQIRAKSPNNMKRHL